MNPNSWANVFRQVIRLNDQDQRHAEPDLRVIHCAFSNCPDEAAVEDLLAALTMERLP